MTMALRPGDAFPDLSWPSVNGDRVTPAAEPGWRMVVVYRGKHCPICRKYLKTLDGLLDRFEEASVQVYAVSADPVERAQSEATAEGWRFQVGGELIPDEMRRLGTFVLQPRSLAETDRPFSEPGLFAINPNGATQVIAVSNAPFARPDLAQVLGGLNFIMNKTYPIRGLG